MNTNSTVIVENRGMMAFPLKGLKSLNEQQLELIHDYSNLTVTNWADNVSKPVSIALKSSGEILLPKFLGRRQTVIDTDNPEPVAQLGATLCDGLLRLSNSDFALNMIERDRAEFKTKRIPTEIQLRELQKRPVIEASDAIMAVGGAVINAPCGSGKSVMGLAVSRAINAKRVLIVVDQTNIANQWVSYIKNLIPKATISKFSKDGELTADYTVATLQTLFRLDRAFNPIEVDLLVVDEVHVLSAPKFVTAMHNIQYSKSLGLSATLDRADKQEWLFLSLIGNTIVTARPDNYPAKVFWVAADNLLDKVKSTHSYANSYNLGKPDIVRLHKDISKSYTYNEWIVNTCVELINKRRNVLVLVKLVDHAETIKRMVDERMGKNACGICAGKRRDKDAFDKTITVATLSIAQKALDVPHKDALILAAPITDPRQAKGRVERKLPGKPTPVVIDFMVRKNSILCGMAKKRMRRYAEKN